MSWPVYSNSLHLKGQPAGDGGWEGGAGGGERYFCFLTTGDFTALPLFVTLPVYSSFFLSFFLLFLFCLKTRKK